MKFVCVALLLTSLLAIGAALGPHNCQSDLECKLVYGEFCFCLKGNYEQGHCTCGMDPKIWNECIEDSDCKTKEYGHKFRTLCKCDRDSPRQAKGQCKCSTALLG